MHVIGQDTFRSVDVRALAPYILQAYVDDAREAHGRTSPLRYRSWEGCFHAIVLKTGASYFFGSNAKMVRWMYSLTISRSSCCS